MPIFVIYAELTSQIRGIGSTWRDLQTAQELALRVSQALSL